MVVARVDDIAAPVERHREAQTRAGVHQRHSHPAAAAGAGSVEGPGRMPPNLLDVFEFFRIEGAAARETCAEGFTLLIHER